MHKVIGFILSIFLFSCGNTLCEKHVVEQEIVHATAGQELIDLKKAFDSGAISQQEYEDLKKKIINRTKKKHNKKKK